MHSVVILLTLTPQALKKGASLHLKRVGGMKAKSSHILLPLRCEKRSAWYKNSTLFFFLNIYWLRTSNTSNVFQVERSPPYSGLEKSMLIES